MKSNQNMQIFLAIREAGCYTGAMIEDKSRGTLAPTEPHPAAMNALVWIRGLKYEDLVVWQSSFSSCAIEGNRLAEVCSETLRRLMDGEPCSSQYILGLAWTMRAQDWPIIWQVAAEIIKAMIESEHADTT